jgi:hypothetical protein
MIARNRPPWVSGLARISHARGRRVVVGCLVRDASAVVGESAMSRLLPLTLVLVLLAPGWLAPAPARAAEERLVLAFYYGWYEPGDWDGNRMPFLPADRYSGGDAAVMRRHLEQAAGARIDGLIASWWGPGDRTDQRLGAMLDLAARTSVRLSAYVETASDQLNTRPALVAGLRQLLQQRASHPAFVRYQGRPVIFVWQPGAVPRGGESAVAAWRDILNEVDPQRQAVWSAEGVDLAWLGVFDGLHQFGAALWASDPGASDRSWRARIDDYNRRNGTAKIWAAGTAPGHDDTRLGRPNPVFVQRADGAYYRRSFAGAISSNPEWITITSFNEWFEGTQIEPSPTYGDLYLRITREMVDRWKGPLLDGSPGAAFGRAWARADALVAVQAVQRAWLWGPTGFDERGEPYAEAPGGGRTVRYYDKARMEITNPNADPAGAGYVTNGLLARELIGGEIQEGDGAFRRHRPARVPVAGDAGAAGVVTYADLARVASWRGDNRAADRTGQVLTERFAPGRAPVAEAGLAGYGVTAGFYEARLGHNIPTVFWDAFQATGPVLDRLSGQPTTGLILDWQADVGLPLMEPVWVAATVGGQTRDVLVQCFERRCLTYTPANPPEWRVEMGNVGLHYHMWRHG